MKRAKLVGGVTWINNLDRKFFKLNAMRIRLEIDEDVLAFAKELAFKERKSVGKILSDGFRRGMGMRGEVLATARTSVPTFRVKDGIPVLPSRGERISANHIRRIMDEEGI